MTCSNLRVLSGKQHPRRVGRIQKRQPWVVSQAAGVVGGHIPIGTARLVSIGGGCPR
jgi:hypothetical protein